MIWVCVRGTRYCGSAHMVWGVLLLSLTFTHLRVFVFMLMTSLVCCAGCMVRYWMWPVRRGCTYF